MKLLTSLLQSMVVITTHLSFSAWYKIPFPNNTHSYSLVLFRQRPSVQSRLVSTSGISHALDSWGLRWHSEQPHQTEFRFWGINPFLHKSIKVRALGWLKITLSGISSIERVCSVEDRRQTQARAHLSSHPDSLNSLVSTTVPKPDFLVCATCASPNARGPFTSIRHFVACKNYTANETLHQWIICRIR